MDGKRKQNKIKKAGAAAVILVLAVLFFVFLARSGRTAPDNPMEDGNADASRMYLTSSTLAMDEEKLADVENANISSGGADGVSAPEEEQEEEEQEEQEEELQTQQEEQQEQSQQTETDSQTPDSSDTSNRSSVDSLLSLIQKQEGGKNPGGGNQNNGGSGNGGSNGGNSGNQGGDNKNPSGGGSTMLGPDASAQLFTTSLADGTVTEAEYPFSISLTAAGKKLTLVSQTVTLNGMPKGCKEQDSVTLQEGVNTISITLRFRDSSRNQIDASTREYTVYYVPENHYLLLVQDARTGKYLENGGEKLVYEDSLWIKVIAQKGAEAINEVRVRINNTMDSSDSDGVYRLPLKNGANTLRVTAGSGVNQQVFTCTVNYKRDHMALTFESAAVTETISGYKFGGRTNVNYRSESPDFAFRVSCSAPTGTEEVTAVRVTTRYGSTDMKNMVGADGYIHFTLDTSSVNSIMVQCLDGDGNTKSYTWNIDFKRLMTEEENRLHAPYIDVQLTSETVHLSPYVMPVAAFDEFGNKLAAANMRVTCNGEELTYAGQSGGGSYYEYNLYLTEGENYVYIYVEDENGYWAEKDLTLTFSPEENSATIHLIVSAEVVGLGNLIDEYVNVPAGYTVAQVAEERLAAYGYTTVHTSEPQNSDYYLAHIQKPGILDGFWISEAEKEWLDMEGIGYTEEPSSMNSLGERDFTTVSGWMISQNYRDLGQSMGAFGIRDGDEIHVIYSLDMGRDVGLGAGT